MGTAYSRLLAFLEDSPWAESIRQSLWLYPVLEIVHITGIVMLVGGAFFFDLRLLGLARGISLGALASYLLPISQKGLLLVIPSGVLLFITNAKSLGVDELFWLKMGLLVLAALNVMVFHRFMYPRIQKPEQDRVIFPAKITALVSIIILLAVIACGRLLAY